MYWIDPQPVSDARHLIAVQEYCWHNFLTRYRCNSFLNLILKLMATSHRGIGSEGLEQGGPDLGNDYSRKDLSTRNAGDALSTPDPGDTAGKGKKDGQETLGMDQESSRGLSGEGTDDDLELDEDASIDELDDEDLLDDDDDDLDLDDDEEDDELDKGL
jgi:hypothetical protein